MRISYYADHFDILNQGCSLDFISTHAILTPVTCRFWKVFRVKPYSLCHSLWPFQYQKMRNVLAHLLSFVTTLPEAAHLRNRPRKNLKIDFPLESHMEWWLFWYHSKWFSKLYKLSYSDSRSIHWGYKIQKFPEFNLSIDMKILTWN